MTVYFQLESGLAKSQYLRFKFPEAVVISSAMISTPLGQVGTSGSAIYQLKQLVQLLPIELFMILTL